MNKLREEIRKRYIYYLIGYALGYVVAIVNKGSISIDQIFPINLFSTLIAILVGTILYYISLKLELVTAFVRGLKYVFLVIIVTIVVGFLDNYLRITYGVDTTPFMGF